jgi:hypothetical protein
LPLSVQRARLAATVTGSAAAGAERAPPVAPKEEQLGGSASASDEGRLEDAALSRAADLRKVGATLERLKTEVHEEFTRKLDYSAAHGLLELPFVERIEPGAEPADARSLCRVAASLEKGYVEASRRFGFVVSGQLLQDFREAGGLEDRPVATPSGASPHVGELAIRPVAQTPEHTLGPFDGLACQAIAVTGWGQLRQLPRRPNAARRAGSLGDRPDAVAGRF